MINVAQAAIFGRQKAPNTFIGGVSGVISTPSLLATKLAILSSDIANFRIVGSDIQCHIKINYNFPNDCFKSDSNIKYYTDLGKLLSFGRSTFEGSGIQNFSSPTVYFESLLTPRSVFADCLDLENCSIPNAKNLTYTTNQGAFKGASKSTIVADLSGVITITGFQTFQSSGFKNLYLNNLVSMTYNGALSNQFASMPNIELIEMKKLKIFLPVNSNNNNFNSIKTGVKIRVNSALLTDNSGTPNAQLVWVKANRSAIVEFYDDAGNYVSTL